MRLLTLLFVLFVTSLPAQAQTRYSAWSDPDQKNNAKLIERLNQLIDRAEKDRAANPAFLRDLRDLTRGYAATAAPPASRTVLSDDFGDGDFTADPAWTVSAGRYWVERGWGLRSAVPVVDPNRSQRQQSKKDRNRKAIFALLGAMTGQSGGGDGATSSSEPEVAAIYSAAAIGNAFTLDMEFSSWVQQGQPSGGQFEFGPYQGNDRSSGYRLSYSPGDGLTLLTVSPKGRRVIDRSVGPMTLEDKKTHALRWTRDSRGRMKISIDGKKILSAIDRGFDDPFRGLTMINRGGDYIIKRVEITAQRP